MQSKQESESAQYVDTYMKKNITVHGCKCDEWTTKGKKYNGSYQ